MRNLLFLIVIVQTLVGYSQSSYVAGLFPTIDHTGSISDKLDYGLYYFAAFPLVNLQKSDISKNAYFNLLYFEQSLSYRLISNLSVTGSYVYQRADVVYDSYVNEHRFYIQAKYKHIVKKLNLTHRLRFDGRFIQNRFMHQTPFTHRVRYLLGMDMPISEKLYLTAYEEAFFNTFKDPGAMYSENWAYAALGKKLNVHNKVEIGILYITWNIFPKNWYNQYYLQLTWINHLDFIKNKKQQ